MYRVARVLACAVVSVTANSAVLSHERVVSATGEHGVTTPSDPAMLAAKVAEIEEKVAYLSKRYQIHDMYLRYMWGFDRRDAELVKSTFWPDAQINYGTTSNSVNEFVAQHFGGHGNVSTNSRHLINDQSVDIDGDVAHVEAYVTEFNTLKNGRSRIVGVRYIDRLDRRNNEWRVAVREVIFQFFTETDNNRDANLEKLLNGRPYSLSPCGMGTLDKRDPTYLRPLKARTKKEFGPACTE